MATLSLKCNLQEKWFGYHFGPHQQACAIDLVHKLCTIIDLLIYLTFFEPVYVCLKENSGPTTFGFALDAKKWNHDVLHVSATGAVYKTELQGVEGSGATLSWLSSKNKC